MKIQLLLFCLIAGLACVFWKSSSQDSFEAMSAFCARHCIRSHGLFDSLKAKNKISSAPAMDSRTGYGKPYPLITSSNPSVQPFVGITYRTPED